MSELCGIIAGSILVNCTTPPQAGTEDKMIVLNRKQIASLTKNGLNAQVIEDIILESGASGFVFEGLNNSIAPEYNMVPGRYFKMWNHQVDFLAFNVSPETKKRMEELKDADIVVIIYNKNQGASGDSAFEIYGLYSGLKASLIERKINDQETQGCFHIVAKTDEERGLEPFQPQTFFDTDYATTLAIVEALV